MKKLIFITLLSVAYIYAAPAKFIEQMNYQSNYEKALQKAKNQNKPIMMVLSTKTCPWCRKLENQTLKKNVISEMVANHFIPLAIDKDEPNTYPPQFSTKVVPTVYFIDPKTQTIFEKSLGYKNKNDFEKVLNEALVKYKGN